MAYNGSIDLISGIRPKNNGKFPLMDAKDVYVTDDKRLDAALNEKAEAVDVIPKPAVEGTTGQILRIDEEGTPAWSDVGTPTEEQVGDAVDAWLTAHPEATTTVQDGTISYNKLDVNLKGHADAIAPTEATATASRAYAVGDHFFLGGVLYEATAAIASGGSIVTTGEGVNVKAVPNLSEQVSDLKSAIAFDETLYAPDGIVDKNNLILGRSMIGRGCYYYGGETASPDYFYISMPVVSGVSYTFLWVRFISGENEGLVNNLGYNTPQSWTATLTGDVYLSIKYESIKKAYFCTSSDYANADYGTGEAPLYNASTLAQSTGQSTKKPVSQKLLTDSLSSMADEMDASLEASLDELNSKFRSALGMIETPQIVGMTSTGKTAQSINLFRYAELVGAGKAIYSISNGKVVLEDKEDYNTYLLHVDGESTYTFTNCRFAVVVSDLEYTAVSQLLTYVTNVASTGGEYIIFSFNPTTYPVLTYSITKPVGVYSIPANWDLSGIEIQTPQISGMLPTGKNVMCSNLFSKATKAATGKYVDRIENGVAVLVDNASYDTYLIPVDGTSTYTFTDCRTAAVVSDLQYTAVGTLKTYATSIDSTGGYYILFSFNPTTYPVSTYSITKPVRQYTIPDDWYVSQVDQIASIGNLFDPSTIKPDKRLDSDGQITTANGYYTSDFIPVLPGCHVTKNSPTEDPYHRIAVYKTASGNGMIPGQLYNANEITIPLDGKYVRFCGLSTEASTAELKQITAVDDNARFLGNAALSQADQVNSLLGSDGIRATEASVSGGATVTITTFPKYLKKGTFVSYYGKFSTFSGLLLGKGYTAYRGDWVEITAQNVVFHHYESNTDNVMQTDAHGLTLSDYIMVTLYMDNDLKLWCSVNSKTGTFTTYIQTGIYSDVLHIYHEAFAGDSFATPTAAMTDVELSVSSGETRNPIWCIGDSYFGVNSERVIGQLKNLGFWDGILFDGLAGLNSQNGYDELTKLLAFGKPKILIWYLGMNDSDPAYFQYMNQVKAYCEENNITLILNKVPTVPTVDNETKDGYVVASECRYINSYLAVGANSSGEWYTGYLSSDNVHPTALGAKALAMRMLVDVPELAEYGYTAAST